MASATDAIWMAIARLLLTCKNCLNLNLTFKSWVFIFLYESFAAECSKQKLLLECLDQGRVKALTHFFTTLIFLELIKIHVCVTGREKKRMDICSHPLKIRQL